MSGMRTAPGGQRALLGLVCLVLSACSADRLEDSVPSADGAEIDVKPRRVALIPPGTVIGDRAPKGWTHLIIKSHPRLGAESRAKVSVSTARLAGLLFTAILADVQPTGQPQSDVRFMLSSVAVGVGTKVTGQDMILTSDTQAKLGARLGFLEGQVLSGGGKQLEQIYCVARSRTMAILDAPSTLLRDKKHQQVMLRYAVLVDPQTGRLDTLLWLLDREDRDEDSGPLSPLQWLPPDKLEDCALDVDPDEFGLLGIPGPKAFAMERMPQGRQAIEFPNELKSTAAAGEFTPSSAQALERALRTLLPAK